MLRLSRAQLYELVWSKPMTDIARQFGVRDLRIAQVCDEYHIARPANGYWQKLIHGKSVEKRPLAEQMLSADHIVAIESIEDMPQQRSPVGKPGRRDAFHLSKSQSPF